MLDMCKYIDGKSILFRDEVDLLNENIDKSFNEKTILITGGGGTIGSEIAIQIARYKIKLLLIIDFYESNALKIEKELERKYEDLNKKIIIADIRDKNVLREIFSKYNIDIVFHAAAYKHVNFMENHAKEAIKNNVYGTLNLAELSDEFDAEKFILISTDKAVKPTTVMGASKRICEKIISTYNIVSSTKFTAVRFGNVLGSNGSVVPIFQKQIEQGGPVTVTDRKVSRYFMLVSEAAKLVLISSNYSSGGELYILDMGKAINIYDLACRLIKINGLTLGKDIDIEIVGLRLGEKLDEELILKDEFIGETNNKKIFLSKPQVLPCNPYKVREYLSNFNLLNGNNTDIKIEISKIIPEYKPQGIKKLKNIKKYCKFVTLR